MKNEHAHHSYPLTVAQRGLWLTQKITPGAILNIAEAVEIHGPIKPEIFRCALHQLVAEAEQLRVRVVEKEGMPRQIPWPKYGSDFPYVDMSHEQDPRQAIHDWTMHEVMQPADLAKGPLWVSALLKASDDSYFWYQRAHHIEIYLKDSRPFPRSTLTEPDAKIGINEGTTRQRSRQWRA
jgi:enterobactin synthetase component F